MANSKLNESTEAQNMVEKADLLDSVHKAIRSQSLAHHGWLENVGDSNEFVLNSSSAKKPRFGTKRRTETVYQRDDNLTGKIGQQRLSPTSIANSPE